MTFDDSITQTTWPSPLGSIILAATGQGLAGLWFEGQRHFPRPREGVHRWPHDPDHPVLRQAIVQLGAYFAGRQTVFDLPLDLSGGTAFQRSVWSALRDIPRGGTVRYGDISQRIGKPAAVRAVGAAIGRNPISIIVPCHRVIGASGALTGYAGGLDRKTALLRLEGALVEALS